MMNYRNLTSKVIIQILLYLTFIVNTFVAEISNYKPYSFLLKAGFSIILILLVFIDYKLNKTTDDILSPPKWFWLLLLLFILIPALSLTYSKNTTFGALKLLNIIFSIIPLIMVFRYLLVTMTNKRLILFIKSIMFLGLLFAIVSLVISPYNPSTVYSFKITRWSHVIGGRFLSSVTVIALLLSFSNILKSKLFLIFTSTILLTATYFVGLKAAVLGIILVIVSLIFWALIRKKKTELLSISLSIAFSFVLILFISQFNHTPANRYGKLLTENLGEINVGGVNARIIAYEKSWEAIKMYPILGVGFGGFNNEEISGDISKIKYPHNLLIETQLELGILGSIFFGVLLTLMFWESYKFSIPIFIFLIFSFWLAMFSKDISTQAQLWIGVGVIGLAKKNLFTIHTKY